MKHLRFEGMEDKGLRAMPPPLLPPGYPKPVSHLPLGSPAEPGALSRRRELRYTGLVSSQQFPGHP